jgi:V8-like Glu-specific endopeptidase
MGSTADTTGGMSGGPVIKSNGFGLYQVLGVHARSTSSVNVHRRWTTYLYNWADSNTAFP